MDWLLYQNISFSSNSSIGQLGEDINETVGQGIYYDMFEIQNTKWFWFVSTTNTVADSSRKQYLILF